jgi:hypothetical protein
MTSVTTMHRRRPISGAPTTAEAAGREVVGEAHGVREIADVKDTLRDLADQVLAGTVERADASTAGFLLNIWIRAAEVERKIKETEELEQRVAELERNRSNNGRFGGRWRS